MFLIRTKSGGSNVSINMDNAEWYESAGDRTIVYMKSGTNITLDIDRDALDRILMRSNKSEVVYDVFQN